MAIAKVQGNIVFKIDEAMIRNSFITHMLTCAIVAGMTGLMPILVCGQIKVTRIDPKEGAAGRKGIVYSLPRTVLALDLLVTRTDRAPGPYASFAAELLGIEDAVREWQTSYTLDKVSISAISEPDPDQVFLVERDEKSSENILYLFTPDGLMAGSEGFRENAPSGEDWEDFFTRTYVTEDVFPAYRKGDMKENIDTITRLVAIDTLLYTEKILKRSMVRQTDREKAEEAASMITGIGQDQYSLLVGYQETAYSGDALRFMIEQLEMQRQNYLRLFTGVTRSEQVRIRLEYIPSPGSAKEPAMVAGFSPAIGLTGSEGAAPVTLTLLQQGLAGVLGGEQSVSVPSGYFYRIPESCEVKVEYEGKTLGRQVLPVNQLGVVRSLPPSVTQVEFYPETGTVKRMILK